MMRGSASHEDQEGREDDKDQSTRMICMTRGEQEHEDHQEDHEDMSNEDAVEYNLERQLRDTQSLYTQVLEKA